MSRRYFQDLTDAQTRALYRRTLAAVVHFESHGISFTRGPARMAAKRLLDLKDPVSTDEIISALMKAAAECIGPDTVPEKADPIGDAMQAFNRLADPLGDA